MDRWIDRWMDEWMGMKDYKPNQAWMDGLMMYAWMMDAWVMDGWIDRWMDEWMDVKDCEWMVGLGWIMRGWH